MLSPHSHPHKHHPVRIARSKDFNGEGNYTFGCAFSPDGLCVLTCSSLDNVLRLYNTPLGATATYKADEEITNVTATTTVAVAVDSDGTTNNKSDSTSSSIIPWEASLVAKEGDSIRGYAWYPLMNSYDPSTCIFISTSREQPMHLIDAYTGSIRCSYRAYDNVDAIEAAQCVSFTNDGQRIFAGFNRCIKIFQISQPGRECEVLHMGKTRRSQDGQKGIVSSIAFPKQHNNHTTSNIFAVGTYAGSIYLYDDRAPSGDPAGVVLSNNSNCGLCVVGHGKKQLKKRQRLRYSDTTTNDDNYNISIDENIFAAAKEKWFQQIGRRGITQLQFTSQLLFSASRRSNAVVCWDIRMLGGTSSRQSPAGLASYERDGDTNQKLEFDVDDDTNTLFVGSQNKCVKIYDISSRKLLSTISGLCDAANGVSYSSSNRMLAVSIGARRFNNTDDDDESHTSISTTTDSADADDDAAGLLELYKLD